MTDKNGINPELLQPEDVVKTKRTRKPKTVKIEEPAVEAKETKTSWQYTYDNTSYEIFQTYQKYFEQQQKSILNYWTTVLNNIWNIPR